MEHLLGLTHLAPFRTKSCDFLKTHIRQGCRPRQRLRKHGQCFKLGNDGLLTRLLNAFHLACMQRPTKEIHCLPTSRVCHTTEARGEVGFKASISVDVNNLSLHRHHLFGMIIQHTIHQEQQSLLELRVQPSKRHAIHGITDNTKGCMGNPPKDLAFHEDKSASQHFQFCLAGTISFQDPIYVFPNLTATTGGVTNTNFKKFGISKVKDYSYGFGRRFKGANVSQLRSENKPLTMHSQCFADSASSTNTKSSKYTDQCKEKVLVPRSQVPNGMRSSTESSYGCTSSKWEHSAVEDLRLTT